MRLTRLISLTNFAVATSALSFQVFVLYPWHHQLSHDFEELKKEHLSVLRTMSDSGRRANNSPQSPAPSNVAQKAA